MLTWALAWMQTKTGHRLSEPTIEFAMILDVFIVLGVIAVVALMSNNG